MKRTLLGALVILAAALVVQSAGAQTATAPGTGRGAGQLPQPNTIKVPDPAQVAKDFAAAAAKSPAYDPATREAIAKAADSAAQGGVVSLGLARAYPEFAQALRDLGDEQPVAAIAALQKQRQSSDVYLAANATYFLARAYVAQGAYEQALPLLGEVTGKYLDKTTYCGEALFLRGACERKTLQREAALQTFTDFLENYKDAPERLRVGAATQQWELLALAQRPLEDVQDRMDFAHNRLAREKSDKEITQAQQNRIIAILDKLIKEAQDRERPSANPDERPEAPPDGEVPGVPGGKPPGVRPTIPAGQSAAPPGQARYPVLDAAIQPNAGKDWGTPDQRRQRDRVNEVIGAKFPDRYRALLSRNAE